MTIKSFYADQAGAPVLSGVVGSLVAVLDACLVNGFNQVDVASITRAGNIVTVQTASAHGYENPAVNWWNKNGVGNVCTIAGADQAAYNGEWAISYVSPTVFTFDIGAATPATPATGTIITKRAPAGFSKAFADANRGVYRSNDTTSRRHYLQVNDIADCPNSQGAMYAGWRGYEVMRGLDDGDYPFPTIVAAGKFGQYIPKSNALNATARGWSLHSDGKAFILCIHPDQVPGSAVSIYSFMIGFGDLLTTAPDAYGSFISGLSSGSSSFTTTTNCGLNNPSGRNNPNPGLGSGWNCIARKYNGQATPVWAAGLLGHGLANLAMGSTAYLAYPNPFDNRLYMSQVNMFDGTVLRGSLPLYESLHGVQHSNREIINNVVGLEGKTLAFLRCYASDQSYNGGLYIDLTGDANGKWS